MIVVPESDTDTDRVSNAARLLIADLEYAQVRSISNAADPCVVVIRPSGCAYYLARQSDPSTPISGPGGETYDTTYGTGRAQSLSGVIVDHTESIFNDRIPYGAFGALDQGEDAVLVLRCGGQSVRVTVDAATGEPSAASN
jgi:hypothetical protein